MVIWHIKIRGSPMVRERGKKKPIKAREVGKSR